MAIADLVESLDRNASVLKQAYWDYWSKELAERSSEMKAAVAEGDTKAVKKIVAHVKEYFGGMGSLNDIGGVVHGKTVDGRRGESADLLLKEQLDDLFFHCLFWRAAGQEAQTRYNTIMKALNKITDSSPRQYYHDKPRWFSKWSD
jgi:hypothetical protein